MSGEGRVKSKGVRMNVVDVSPRNVDGGSHEPSGPTGWNRVIN